MRKEAAPPATVTTAELTLPGGERAQLGVPSHGDVVADQLLSGAYELPPAHALVLDLLPAGGLLLDVGAHLGTLVVPAARGGATVVAVEPNPTNASLLRANTSGLDVRVVEAAAGARPGTLPFLPDGPWGRITRRRQRGTIDVDVVSGAELLPVLGRPADVVKLDVEGSEVEVLAGLAPVLAHRPPLIFECNAYALALRSVPVERLTRAVEALGYEVFRIDPPNRLLPAGSATFQARSWIDCLAVAGGPPTGTPWVVGPRPSAGDIVDDIVVQARDPHAGTRVWLATALAGAPSEVLGDARVTEALRALAADSERRVRRAAKRTIRRAQRGTRGRTAKA
ncbi:MAG: FkbM family methyltransferase [Acidobacteria bacterium]|nr:FkbM family methyltransferase [Acidobacteriota bacterium]